MAAFLCVIILLFNLFIDRVSAFSDQAKPPLHPKQLREQNKKLSSLKRRTAIPTIDSSRSSPAKTIKTETQSGYDNYSTLDADERVQKVIAHAGIASRRNAERMVSSFL